MDTRASVSVRRQTEGRTPEENERLRQAREVALEEAHALDDGTVEGARLALLHYRRRMDELL